jgi:hypothetical protein
MKRLILGICLLAATACLQITAPGSIDERLTLGPGEQASVAGVNIRFELVTGDSRCPADALCIQGGDAVVKITATQGFGGRVEFDLHTGDMKPVSHGDLTIALVQLEPYPFSSHPIDPKDYRVTLRITR